jgi:hypothetical protein
MTDLQERIARERAEFVSHTWQTIRKGEPVPHCS